MKEHVKLLSNFLKSLYWECKEKQILLLASSSSFFLILTFVPFSLLITRMIGFFFGSDVTQFEDIFSKIILFLPSDIIGVVEPIKAVIVKSLFAKKHFTLINIFFLFLSSLGFVNSIWRSLVVITGDQSLKNYKKYFRGFGVVAISFIFISATFLFPIFLKGINFILSTRIVTDVLEIFNLTQAVKIGTEYIFSASILSTVGLVAYTTILFRYLLNKFVDLKSAFAGAINFVLSFIVLKTGFLYYVDITRKGLVDSYGAYYSVVLLLIWILFSMTLFYFSIIFSMLFHKFTKA